MNRKRLLISSEGTLGIVSGVTKLIRILLHHAQLRNYDVTIIAPQDIYDTPAEVINLTHDLHILKSYPVPFYGELRFCRASSQTISQIFEQVQPNLVHAFDPYVLGRTVMREGRRRNIPVVASYHTHIPGYLGHYWLTPLNPIIWGWLRSNHTPANCTLAPTYAIAAELQSHGIDPVKTWTRGIDTTRFNPRHRDAELREVLLDGRQHIALYAGRMAAEKNIQLLIDALVDCKDIRLVLIGEGPLRKELHAKYESRGVVVAGVKTGQMLLRYFASSDVFVFGSTTETFGQVLIEAMASGLPIAAVDCPVTREVLGAHPPGILSKKSPAYFRAAVMSVLTNRDHFSKAGRTIALKRTWQNSMDQLFDTYQQVLKKHN